ncbi:MAG: hypothetical protein QXW97_00015 [Candidatus Pacearchaeota archaeon]
MKSVKFFVTFIVIILFIFPTVYSAHYIVGIVNDARDGTSANGKYVVLFKQTNVSDNLTDIIGPLGNSGYNNIYMIDCELLKNPCNIGDTLIITILNTGDNYISSNVSVTVSSAGYDIAPNLTVNSPPSILSLIVDDSISSPPNEIDLVAAGNRTVSCIGIVNDMDNDTLQNITARFFDSSFSNYNDIDDNNKHYTNNSCYLNSSYIGNPGDKEIICNFYVMYYANSGNWNCILRVEDNLSAFKNSSDSTFINQLLAIGVDSFIDYNSVSPNLVSDEVKVNVTNYGNVKINLSLRGYAVNENDNFAMNCTVNNISIMHQKYNLTASNPGNLTLSKMTNYTNLSSSPIIKKFNLNYRQNDDYNDAINTTYWRIYVEPGVNGTCSGHIQFGAVIGAGT